MSGYCPSPRASSRNTWQGYQLPPVCFPQHSPPRKGWQKDSGHPGLNGRAGQLPLASCYPAQQESLTTHYFLCAKTLGKYATPRGGKGAGCMWGPQHRPGSTHPAGATSWLPPPGPESCDLADTPKLSKPFVEFCPFALPGMVGMYTGGARKGSAEVQEGQLLGLGLGDTGTHVFTGRGSRQLWEGQGAASFTVLPHL